MNYYIIENGLQIGPLTIEQLKFKNISPNTQVWCEGMPEWKKAREVSELSVLFTNNTPPPPPFSTRHTYSQPQPTEPRPEDHLALSIVATVLTFFLCFPLPIGVVGLIYSLSIDSKWKRCDYETAKTYSRYAKIWGIASICLAISVPVIYVLAYILSGALYVGFFAGLMGILSGL